jgi:hypothetical protein
MFTSNRMTLSLVAGPVSVAVLALLIAMQAGGGLPDNIAASGKTAEPTPYSADHSRIAASARDEEPAPTF